MPPSDKYVARKKEAEGKEVQPREFNFVLQTQSITDEERAYLPDSNLEVEERIPVLDVEPVAAVKPVADVKPDAAVKPVSVIRPAEDVNVGQGFQPGSDSGGQGSGFQAEKYLRPVSVIRSAEDVKVGQGFQPGSHSGGQGSGFQAGEDLKPVSVGRPAEDVKVGQGFQPGSHRGGHGSGSQAGKDFGGQGSEYQPGISPMYQRTNIRNNTSFYGVEGQKVWYWFKISNGQVTREMGSSILLNKMKYADDLRRAIWEDLKKRFESCNILAHLYLSLWKEGGMEPLGPADSLQQVFDGSKEHKVYVTSLVATTWDTPFILPAPAPAAAHSRVPSALPYDGFFGRVYRTSRKKTVQKIVEVLLENGVVLVRGPPQSGKTCLLELLIEHFESKPGYKVDFLCMREYGTEKSFEDAFMAAFKRSWADHVRDTTAVKIFLVDEAQVLFDEKRWRSGGFFDYTRVRNSRLRIVLAFVRGCRASHGMSVGVNPSPEELKARPEVKLWGTDEDFALTLTADDYAELWQSWLEAHPRSQLPPYIKEYIGHICNMQPGLICPVVDYVWEKLVYGCIPPEHHEAAAVKILTSYPFYIEMAKRIRSMAGLKDPNLAEFLLWLCSRKTEDVHVTHIPAGLEEGGAAYFYQMGSFAVAEDMYVSFLSPLHRAVFLINHFKLTSGVDSSLEEFDKDFGKFIIGVVELMDTNVLAKSEGITGTRTRNERVFMDEFYRVGTSLIPYLAVWSPEVGSSFQVPGRVDYFCSQLGWFVEGMRNGLNKDEHLQRFKKGGTYWKFFGLQMVREWAVLDFAQENLAFEAHEDGFWQVRFDNDFRAATIKTPKGEIVTKSLHGMYTMDWQRKLEILKLENLSVS